MNINTAGLAEGPGLGAALGFDLTMLREVFAQTGANSRVLETDGEDMQKRDHECYFSAAHAAKDSGIALELAKAAGLNLPLAEATKKQYEIVFCHSERSEESLLIEKRDSSLRSECSLRSPTTSSPLDNPLTPHNPLPPLVRGIKGEKGGRGVVGSLRSPTPSAYGHFAEI